MKYNIEIERDALKTLKKIPSSNRNKIIQAVESLASNPRPTISSPKIVFTEASGWGV